MEIENGALEGQTQIQELRPSNCDTWIDHDDSGNNSTLLYIAVEYVKKVKPNNENSNQTVSQETYTDFATPQVSPLDPNMSSVAQYSPVSVQYQENSNNQIVIQQYLTQEDNGNITPNTLNNVPSEMPVLCNSELRTCDDQYFEMVENENVNICNELVQEAEQQGVELLITDHATGISYSVNTQELLVERCLNDEQQLLEAISPDPLLESNFLALDDSSLKCELNGPVINSTINEEEVVGDYIDCLSSRSIENSCFDNKIHTRNDCRTNIDPEEELLSCVYSIMDKPILSRARASLPESYLSIGKVNEENAVFAKKVIPKRTQFGPLEGTLLQKSSSLKDEEKTAKFYVFIDGNTYAFDVADENTSNWMGFVRKATTYEEQNLIITQEGNGVFFTATKHITPKEELKAGYSSSYAQQFNLELLKPIEKNTWPCYECSQKFASSEELQKHLNVHDQERDENAKPKRKYKRKLLVLKKSQMDVVECNVCHEPFSSNVNYNTLKNHLSERHKCNGVKIGDYFSIFPNFECNYCDTRFRTEILLNIHKLEHDPELFLEQTNHVCPQCQRKFPTRRQLVLHVTNHALPKKVIKDQSVRCMVCYKLFAHRDRLQKHMLVHGSDDAKPLQCKTCKRRFLTNSALSGHIKTHYTGQKNFECPICNEGFDHVLKLKLHVPKHAHNNQYTCPHCKKIFKKYSIIRKHIRAFHSEPKFSCTHCSKMFPTQGHLKKHMLRHSDHREFLCADCGKQFKRKDKLSEHIKKIHPEGKKGSNEEPMKRKKFLPKVEPTDFHRFIYKCHACLVGFKRRGMLVNHLAKRHPDIRPDSVPELNLPILQTTRDYYCQYCDKVYKSSSKRKVHILKNHPGAALPVNSRQQGKLQNGVQNPSYSHTVGSVTTRPKKCQWCHKQYASKAKLLQHVRKEHPSNSELEPHIKEVVEVDMPKQFIFSPKKETAKQTKVTNDILQSKDCFNGQNMSSGFVVALKQLSSQNNEICLAKGTEVTTDGNINEITTTGIDTFGIHEESKYCHLSINENEIIEGGELESHNSHLYHLLTAANNGMLPPR